MEERKGEEIAKMQSATVWTRVRADSEPETVQLCPGRLVSLVFNLQRKIFMSLFFFSSFFLFYPPFLPRFFAFCFLRSSFVFSFFLFFCVSSYREGILVKYQMRHFYRGFIASTSDKFLGIKVENPRCTRLRILSDLIGWMCLVPSYRS